MRTGGRRCNEDDGGASLGSSYDSVSRDDVSDGADESGKGGCVVRALPRRPQGLLLPPVRVRPLGHLLRLRVRCQDPGREWWLPVLPKEA
ncbi:unnamed protein product, partial [Urochloa humidicola]